MAQATSQFIPPDFISALLHRGFHIVHPSPPSNTVRVHPSHHITTIAREVNEFFSAIKLIGFQLWLVGVNFLLIDFRWAAACHYPYFNIIYTNTPSFRQVFQTDINVVFFSSYLNKTLSLAVSVLLTLPVILYYYMKAFCLHLHIYLYLLYISNCMGRTRLVH